MGKSWDKTGITYNPDTWKEVLRVLKPGGHLLSFGGTRTYHRMASAIEDAGFEIRDQIQWLYGSGFPKSQNIALAIDKKKKLTGHRGKAFVTAGVGSRKDIQNTSGLLDGGYKKPKSKQAKQWDGWGSALKPANEPIVLARKPLSEKTIIANVLKWGTGAINIDASRIESKDIQGTKIKRSETGFTNAAKGYHRKNKSVYVNKTDWVAQPQGRWPSNVILDDEAGKILDKQRGQARRH